MNVNARNQNKSKRQSNFCTIRIGSNKDGYWKVFDKLSSYLYYLFMKIKIENLVIIVVFPYLSNST